jgi:hypothetical protein
MICQCYSGYNMLFNVSSCQDKLGHVTSGFVRLVQVISCYFRLDKLRLVTYC